MHIIVWENRDVFEEDIFNYLQGFPTSKEIKTIHVECKLSEGCILLLEGKIFEVVSVVNEIAVIWEIEKIPITKNVFRVI